MLAGWKAWELDPEKGTLPLATFLSDIGDLGTAKILVNQMLDEYSSAAQRQEWLIWMGDISRNGNKWEDAILFYRQALDEQPQSVQAHIGLGWTYYEQGDGLEKALQEFSMAVAQTPENGQGYFAIGQILAREGRYKEADVWFDIAVKQIPENRWWGLAHINNLRAAGNLTDAILLYKESIQLFPDWDYVYFEIAWAYRLDNQPAEAISTIEEAIVLQKIENSRFYTRAGVIYEWAGLYESAIAAFENSLRLNPTNTDVQDALTRLQFNQ